MRQGKKAPAPPPERAKAAICLAARGAPVIGTTPAADKTRWQEGARIPMISYASANARTRVFPFARGRSPSHPAVGHALALADLGAARDAQREGTSGD